MRLRLSFQILQCFSEERVNVTPSNIGVKKIGYLHFLVKRMSSIFDVFAPSPLLRAHGDSLRYFSFALLFVQNCKRLVELES